MGEDVLINGDMGIVYGFLMGSIKLVSEFVIMLIEKYINNIIGMIYV